MKDADWYGGYFERLRKDYGNLRIAILHVTAPRDQVFERAKSRALVTGRIVPTQTLESSLRQVPRSVRKLAPHADFFCELDNGRRDLVDGKEVEYAIATEGVTAESFQDVWAQTCALPPGNSAL